MPIRQGVKLIERVHQGLVSFWEDPWCLGLQEIKLSSSFYRHKVEYIAVGHCCAQLLWMRQTLRDYGYKLSKVPLLCDNESAIRNGG
jgi:hypothetical protein